MVSATNPYLPTLNMSVSDMKNKGIQIATPDILLDTDFVSVNAMSEYVFASIGGTEILSASRYDLIDSPLNNEYTPIIDVGTRFVRNKTIPVVDGSQRTFASFEIDLNNHFVNDIENTVEYVRDNENNLVAVSIQLKDLKSTYRVEVEIFTNFDLDSI
jgi:hypothetical protein